MRSTETWRSHNTFVPVLRTSDPDENDNANDVLGAMHLFQKFGIIHVFSQEKRELKISNTERRTSNTKFRNTKRRNLADNRDVKNESAQILGLVRSTLNVGRNG